jgi:pyruvate formate lyase activating enzyme
MHARIVNVQKFSLHDGPGIRTLVFFKGCPLHCLWCANPECISPAPEIGFNRALCNKCGKCIELCREGAITPGADGFPVIDRSLCTACGECVTACTPQALTIYGRNMPLDELFEEVRGDMMFYKSSGGGVTVSGGEPLLQADYVIALFELCRKADIGTAVETCGYIKPEILRETLKSAEFIFFDLKCLDERKHLEYTGKDNRLILENARVVVESNVDIQFRMPLIPGLNDDIDNIRATSAFLRSLSKDTPFSIELMPYHRLGTGKYEALGLEYPLKELDMASTEVVEMAKRRFEELGITCLISR